jgi:hypothetical protein
MGYCFHKVLHYKILTVPSDHPDSVYVDIFLILPSVITSAMIRYLIRGLYVHIMILTYFLEILGKLFN